MEWNFRYGVKFPKPLALTRQSEQSYRQWWAVVSVILRWPCRRQQLVPLLLTLSLMCNSTGNSVLFILYCISASNKHQWTSRFWISRHSFNHSLLHVDLCKRYRHTVRIRRRTVSLREREMTDRFFSWNSV